MRKNGKQLLSLLLCLALALTLLPAAPAQAAGDVAINATNFLDANFRSYVTENCDTDGDGSLSADEIAAVTYIECSGMSIGSLKGIEHFTALEELSCYNNKLTALDLSKNTALTELNCSYNQLTALDVSANTALTELECEDNQLTALDLSKNTGLGRLKCRYNQLTTLDLSKNTGLWVLMCEHNQLTALDLSNNTEMTSLYCSDNQLTILDVSKNTALYYLVCSRNRLTALDLSRSTTLSMLMCNDNQLTSLDVSKNTALWELDCQNNQLTALDLGKNTELGKLECYNNQLTKLDVSACPKLTEQLQSAEGFSPWSGSTVIYGEYRYEEYAGSFRCALNRGLWVDLDTKLTPAPAHPPVVKPTITTEPKSVSVKVGETATFKVAASGANLKYQWYYQMPGTTSWTKVANNGTSATYKLTTAARHNGYLYTCKVYNDAGQVWSGNAKLTVASGKPAITTQPKNVSVKAGETATFKVAASGANLKYQWYYQAPGTTSWTKVANNGTSATYKLTTAARHNGYTYSCKVYNDAGTVWSGDAVLTVK